MKIMQTELLCYITQKKKNLCVIKNLLKPGSHFQNHTKEEKKVNNCENCIYNDDGLCDRKGILVEDEDTCDKWSERQVDWKERMLSTFLAGH